MCKLCALRWLHGDDRLVVHINEEHRAGRAYRPPHRAAASAVATEGGTHGDGQGGTSAQPPSPVSAEANDWRNGARMALLVMAGT
eukprot:6953597-Prymnesium_polylepis.1